MALVTGESLCLKTRINLDMMEQDFGAKHRDDRSFQGVRFVQALQDEEVARQVSYDRVNDNGYPNPTGLGGVCPTQTHRVVFQLPDCGDKAPVAVTFGCTTGTPQKEQYGESEIVIDDFIGDEFTISAGDFDCDCDSTPDKAFQIALERSVIKQMVNYNAKLVGAIYAGLGQSYKDNTKGFANNPIGVSLFNAAGTLPQPMELFKIEDEYKKQFGTASDILYLADSVKLRAYLFSQKIFSGNVDGNDSSRSDIQLGNYYMDSTVASTLAGLGEAAASEPILTARKGSVVIGENYQFKVGKKRITPGGGAYFAPMQYTGKLLRQVMDVGTGTVGIPLMADVEMFHDECPVTGPIITVRWRKDFGVWKAPQELFCASPTGSAYNGCLLWNALCQDSVCPV